MYSLSSTEPQLGQNNSRSDRTELCTAWAVQNHSLDRTITDRREQSYVQLEQYRTTAIVLSELWFCTAQAVHYSVLSDLLWSCPICGSVLLKLYIDLFCPICYGLAEAVVSTEPQLGQDNNRSDRIELCTAWAVQSRSSDRTITDRREHNYSAMVLSNLWFCTAQAVHRSVLSDLLWSCQQYRTTAWTRQ
jgi:uncharacterized Zn finger protein (UPF0148 family)